MNTAAAYVSAYDLAPLLGVREPRKVTQTLVRAGVQPCDKTGRIHLYRLQDVIERTSYGPILRNRPNDVAQISIRRTRNDKGTQRKRNQAAVDHATKLALQFYLSSGMQDCRFACEMALKATMQAAQLGQITATADEVAAIDIAWFYKRHIMRKDAYHQGPYYSQGWPSLWKTRYKQHNVALTSVHSRREMYKIFESAGWAGEGHGFGKMITLDDRSADVVTVGTDDPLVLPNGIYAWDTLTGCLLWVTPLKGGATTQAYVQTILMATLYWQISDAPIIVLENAQAAKSMRLDQMAEWLYDREALEKLTADRNLTKLFNGQRGPIYRNVPHIAREIGKAAAERGFGIIKREHDARFSPDSFQGGNRDEAVQMHRSNTPWYRGASLSFARHKVAELKTVAEYFDSVWDYMQGDFLTRERGSLKPWAKDKGLAPTRMAMATYYGRAMRTSLQVPDERMACAIYYATEAMKRAATVTAPGWIRVMMDGRSHVIVSAQITAGMVGRKIGVCPMPLQEDHYVLVLLKHGKKDIVERLVDVARGRLATTIDEDIRNRQEVRAIRIEIQDTQDRTVKESIEAVSLPAHLPQEALPAPVEWVDRLEAPDASTVTEEAKGDDLYDDEQPLTDDEDFNSIINL
jgi:hypothetical protein